LKENFDRINFVLYKEKQMADFRRWFTVLAVLAVMAFSASAQVGVANGSANSLLACVATAAGTPELRPEGYTELAGDIVISCTGGPTLQPGANIPTTNIVVYMAPSVPITSRYMTTSGSGTGASEALLIIDEAGSTITTGVLGNYGPKAPQTGCTYSQQTTVGGSTCNAIVGVDPGTAGGPYEVAVSPTGCVTPFTGCTAAQNVYQGKIGDYGVNSVTFYNVPVLPPATSGVTRTFRITNIRVPIPGGNLSGTLQAIISTNPNQTLPVAGTAINIGIVGPSMTAAVKQYTKSGGNPFQQCQPQTVELSANLIFTEGFATGFKTRVVPGGAANGIPGNGSGNTTFAAEGTNTAAPSNQNIPGGLYGGFAANTESGFIFPSLVTNNTATGALNYTAGLADYGSRLKAVFYNIPAGITLYVSTTSGASGAATTSTSVPVQVGGTSVRPYAVLVATNSGEATPDSTNFSPITSSTAGFINGTVDNLQAIALSATATGSATAVWEVTNSNPSAVDSLSFSVYISYAPTAASATNPYGTPITTLPLGIAPNDVQLSYAPEPSQGAFSTANATQGQTPTPRFAVIKTQEGPFAVIQLCQTTLLYPFVTGATGFDTGIAVANTTWDPTSGTNGGTVNQVGSCKLYAYGVTVGAAGNTPLQTTVPGCDSLANPVAGTNCFPVVPAGQVQSVLASATLTNFQGYVIAVCNFQLAHGYAAVTDLGIRNLWSSYLALELSSASIGASNTRGTSIVNGVETLAH
jgi:hypothetical protein